MNIQTSNATALRQTPATAWLAKTKISNDANLRLFCFPYAGGGASIYRSWASRLSMVELLPVQLPGRETRLKEAPYTNARSLVRAMGQALLPYFDRPFCFFGHSMGALLAYEIARRAGREGWTEPLHLFASGRRPPHVPGKPPLLHDLGREELLARLRGLGGLPPEVAEHEELMDLMLPLLRADLRSDETYAPATHPPLSCPITALAGTSDENADREAAARWGELTTGPSRVVEIEGGHFFVQQAAGAVAETVARTLLTAR